MLAAETKTHQLPFFKRLTNIPKWLVAQKKSEGKGYEPRMHSATLPLAETSPVPPGPATLRSPLFAIRDHDTEASGRFQICPRVPRRTEVGSHDRGCKAGAALLSPHRGAQGHAERRCMDHVRGHGQAPGLRASAAKAPPNTHAGKSHIYSSATGEGHVHGDRIPMV